MVAVKLLLCNCCIANVALQLLHCNCCNAQLTWYVNGPFSFKPSFTFSLSYNGREKRRRNTILIQIVEDFTDCKRKSSLKCCCWCCCWPVCQTLFITISTAIIHCNKSKPSGTIFVLIYASYIRDGIIIIIIIITTLIIIIFMIGSGRVTCLGGGLGVAGRFTCAAWGIPTPPPA